MDAVVIVSRCTVNKLMFGNRVQKMSDGDWWRTWAFPIDEKRAHNEGYDVTPIRGNLRHTEDFPGCPYCGRKSFVQCNLCNKLTCYNGESRLECAWCGNDMRNITTVTNGFSLTGGDI